MTLDVKPSPPSSAPDAPTLVHAKPLLDDVLREEAAFANQSYAPYAYSVEINNSMLAKYTMPSALYHWRSLGALLLGDIRGKAVLDYGCGMGEEAVYLAKLGAHVTAIDVSDVGIATVKRRAEAHKLDICAFEMRCDPTSFPNESFDRIHGMGILHHVGIDRALEEVHRLLRPGGIGVFLEPLGDEPIIETVKSFLMKHARFISDFEEVTDHEHNLTWAEIDRATARFTRTLTFPYHVLFRLHRMFPRSTYDTVRRIDQALLAVAPRLRRIAGAVVIQVTK